MSIYLSKIIERVCENTESTTNPGMIIASPSEDPPYKFHWIRDSALVMRIFIDMYEQTKDSRYFQSIINYIVVLLKLFKHHLIFKFPVCIIFIY